MEFLALVKGLIPAARALVPRFKRLWAEKEAGNDPKKINHDSVDALFDDALVRLGAATCDAALWKKILAKAEGAFVRPGHFSQLHVGEWLSRTSVKDSLRRVMKAWLSGAKEEEQDRELLLNAYMDVTGDHRVYAENALITTITMLKSSIVASGDQVVITQAQAGFAALQSKLDQMAETLTPNKFSPWMSLQQFFDPYLEIGHLFNHKWKLIGRASEKSDLLNALEMESVYTILLMGAPGAGKTRLTRDVLETLSSRPSAPRLLFLPPSVQVNLELMKSLEGGNKVIVVDDAHNRDDLDLLFHHCAVSANRTKLFLVTRTYGKERIKHQAATMSLSGPHVHEVTLLRPTPSEVKDLAVEVLAFCGGPVHMADQVAKATYDNALVTVIASQLVAREGKHPALINNASEFRENVLSRLQDVITGNMVGPQDAQRVQSILRIIALVQPIILNDQALLTLINEVERVETADASRLMGILIEGGVLFRRGNFYQLSPDLLSDSIINRNCLNVLDGTSNGYAENVFDLAPNNYLKNILVNLGQLDWRLRDGKTDDSQLLKGLWSRLRWQDSYPRSHVEAAAAVAYFQPKMALMFAQKLIDEGHGCDSNVCNIMKNAAYNFEHLGEASALLWNAGNQDSRPLNQQPSHAIRILTELARFEPNKPPEYVVEVVDFTLSIVDNSSFWWTVHTPFEILEGALAVEGHVTTSSTSRVISFSNYWVTWSAVASTRARIIDKLLDCIGGGMPRQAYLAAKTLPHALRRPGTSREVLEAEMNEWECEQVSTLERVLSLVEKQQISAPVLVSIAEAISWHASYGTGRTRVIAESLITSLNRDLETRCIRAMIDGWGHKTWPLRIRHELQEYEQEFKSLIDELEKELTSAREIYDYLEQKILYIKSIMGNDAEHPYLFVQRVLDTNVAFCAELITLRLNDHEGSLSILAGYALGVLLNLDSKNAQIYVKSILDKAGSDELTILTRAYSHVNSKYAYSDLDKAALREVFSSKEAAVLFHAAQVFRSLTDIDVALANELVVNAKLEVAGYARDQFFSAICDRDYLEQLSLDIWSALFSKLIPVPDLNDYWIRDFVKNGLRLSTVLTVDFLIARLERFNETKDWSYDPLGTIHSRDEGLKFGEVSDHSEHLRRLLDWTLIEAKGEATLYKFGELISGLYGDYPPEIFDVLLSWLAVGEARHANVVATVLRNVGNDISIKQQEFIVAVLDTARMLGREEEDKIISALVDATGSGVRGTTPGEPFQEDLQVEQNSLLVLEKLDRFSPAYKLYKRLLERARAGIARQRQEKEALDAEDEEAQYRS